MKETDLMKEIERLQAENDRLKCQVQGLKGMFERTTNGIWEMVSREEFIDMSLNCDTFTGFRINFDDDAITICDDVTIGMLADDDDSTIYIAKNQEA